MTNHTDSTIWKPAEVQGVSLPESAIAELEVDVVFTTPEGTLAALRKASELSRDLGASVRLIVPQLVPYACDIDCPPVNVEFIRRRMLGLVLQTMPSEEKTTIDIYLCREKEKTLRKVLKPGSLVVIANRRHWWPTEESRLAKALRSNGHQVVSVDLK
jgi:hypothetical protein